MSLAIGTRVGPYEVDAALGAGGMGEVYRARDTRLERSVGTLHEAMPERLVERFFASLADVTRKPKGLGVTLFVLLHSAAKLDNWVSFAVWAMIITVVSGLVGRYLSTELPDLASQAALHVLELDRQLGELRNKHSGVAAADRYYEAARRRFARVSAPELSGAAGSLLAVTTLLRDELSRPLRRFKLRGMLKGVKDPRARREVARLTSHLVLLERRRLLLPRIGPLFKEWKAVHIPFAIILTILSGIHIIIELRRQ